MTASTLLAARQLAALRRHRWTTLDAAGFVAQALPAGELKSACERALQALKAGGPSLGGSAIEKVLARGEAATPEAFECLAESVDARAHADAGVASAVGMARILVAGPLLLGCLFGWLVVPAIDDVLPGMSMPAPTELSIALLSLLAYAGPPLALAAWLLLPRGVRRFAPGARDLALAAELYDASAAGSLAPPPRELAGADLDLYLWRAGKAGAPVAAREAAEHLHLEGRAKIARFDRLAPIVVLAFGAGACAALVVPLMLPLFSIAGAIR